MVSLTHPPSPHPHDSLPTYQAFRGLVVARMPGLRQFNGGTPISAQERMYAERLWLRRGDGYDEATASAATKSLWAELMARHGPQRQAPTTHTLKDSLVWPSCEVVPTPFV